MTPSQEEVFNIKSSYFLWHLNELQLHYTDFCHALHLLENHGLAPTPASAGRTLGTLVDSYLHYNKCSLADVDLSRLTAQYLVHQAQEVLEKQMRCRVTCQVTGRRALTSIALTQASMGEVLEVATRQVQHQAIPLESWLECVEAPAKQLLQAQDFNARLAARLQEHTPPVTPELSWAPCAV